MTKIKNITNKARQKLLLGNIEEMKKENFSIEVINNYEEQLQEVSNTIIKEDEHDNRQKELLKVVV